MTYIAEHNPKKERECSTGINRWINFLVVRHTVCVCDCLEDICELICPKESRRLNFFEWNLLKVQFEIARVVLRQINYSMIGIRAVKSF
jgi:hypothetical protein